jgi:hypothetical protein
MHAVADLSRCLLAETFGVASRVGENLRGGWVQPIALLVFHTEFVDTGHAGGPGHPLSCLRDHVDEQAPATNGGCGTKIDPSTSTDRLPHRALACYT